MFITDAANFKFWQAKERPCIYFETKFRIAINNYLLRFYRGEKIDLFEFNFCLCSKHKRFSSFRYDYPDRDRCSDGDGDVDGWIKFALSKGVESLTLFGDCLFDCCKKCYFSYGKDCVFEYFFRTQIFEGIGATRRCLKHLKLNSSLLGPNFTNQLSSLETLSLSRIGCLAPNLQSMFPFLSNLKTLEITNSAFPGKLSVASLSLLENFLVRNVRKLEEIELSNPYLVDFKFFVVDEVGFKCNLSGARNITSLSYLIDFPELHLLLTDLQCLQDLRNLTILTPYIDWYDTTVLERRYDCKLSQVTHLNRYNLHRSSFSFVRAMSILEVFPRLRTLRLMMHCPEDVEDEINIEHDVSYVPEYLTEVFISHFHCTKLEMQFAVYLLKYSSALEKLSIVLPPEKLQLLFDEGQYCGMTCSMAADTLRKFDTRNILDVRTAKEDEREDAYNLLANTYKVYEILDNGEIVPAWV